jgi:hypothetical protein
MGTYYYWVNDKHKIYIEIGSYNEDDYDEELYEKFFSNIGLYNEETSKLYESLTEKTIKDLTFSDLTNVLISAKRYNEIMYHDDKDLFIFLLNRFSGDGRVISEYDEDFAKIEKEYKNLTKEE